MLGTATQFNQRCRWVALLLLTTCFFVSPLSVSLTTVTYIGACVFLSLSGEWRSRWNRLRHNKAALSFLLLFALFIIGIFYSTSPWHQILRDLDKHIWLLITPFLMMLPMNNDWRRRMMNAFLWAMIITLLLSFIKWATHRNVVAWIPFSRLREGSAIFMFHIAQSFAMNIAAFICAYRFLFEKKWRIFYVIIFALMAINIVFINTGRTGYGIFFALLFYFGLMRFGWKGMLSTILLSVAIITIAFFTSHSFQTRMKEVYQHAQDYKELPIETSIGQRIEMWGIAKRMIRERPWFGYGSGGIRAALPAVVPPKYRKYNPSIDYVESIYLNFLLEFGVVGLTVFLIAMVMQIKATFQLPLEYKCLMQSVLIAVLFGGLINSFFVAFSIPHFYSLFSVICFYA